MTISPPSTGHPVTSARLPIIEATRGIAATIVAGGHILQLRGGTFRSHTWFQAPLADKLLWPFKFGAEMVALFLFLSAFTLAYQERLRLARGDQSSLWQYARRRAWRIGPVYYAALALGLAVVLVVPEDAMHAKPEFENLPPSVGGLLSHLFLLHNGRPPWSTQINGPLWSLSYEAELYLALPALLMLMRKSSPWLVAGVGALAAEAAIGHVPAQINLVTPFLFGLLGAFVYDRLGRRTSIVSLIAGVSLLLYGLLGGPFTDQLKGHDLVWFGAALLLIPAACAVPETKGLGRGCVVEWLGKRSYSLYAFHFPVLLLAYTTARWLASDDLPRMLITAVLAVPAILVVTALAHQAIEAPSMRRVRAVA